MGKVCLVKAGKFLLGLEVSHVISTLDVDDLKAEEIDETGFIFLFLKSFLAQKHLDISGSNVIILKNKSNKKHLALLVDRTLGEIELPDQFEPHPMLYPELAAQCCPKIFIHKNQIVLLLDPKQLNITHKKLRAQTNYGLIALNDLLPVKEEVEQEDIYQTDNGDTSYAKNQPTQPEPETEIDDKTISSIVSWTFDKYNEFYCNEKVIKFYSNEKIIISVNEIPLGLLQQQGLSNESLQLLIDKTILQCEKTRYKTIKNMIKDQLNEIL